MSPKYPRCDGPVLVTRVRCLAHLIEWALSLGRRTCLILCFERRGLCWRLIVLLDMIIWIHLLTPATSAFVLPGAVWIVYLGPFLADRCFIVVPRFVFVLV